ncbi:hypothetical protein [Methylobacterium nigriterrae]|uniref:hypothetical protein n=1 Tax=Methylobacterium nigriterrae TaxID=3127512 RepID=UPI003013B9DF
MHSATGTGESMSGYSQAGAVQNGEAANQRHYRAFVLDADGNVLRIEHLTVQNDDAAISLAGAMVEGRVIELWDGLRFIEHFEPSAATK